MNSTPGRDSSPAAERVAPRRHGRAVFAAAVLALAPAGMARAAGEDALLQADREFSQLSVQRGAAEAFFRYCAEDAVQFPVGGAPLHGREQIRDSLVSERPYVLRWTPRAARVATSGELGYTWGTYELETTDKEGQPKMHYGKYLTVWKRDPGGPWRVSLDIGNPGPAP